MADDDKRGRVTDSRGNAPETGGTQRGATGLDRDALARAMEQAWGDFVGDTGCHPDCFTWRNGKLFADFWTGPFAEYVAGYLAMDRQVRPIYDEGYQHGSGAATKHCYEAVEKADSLDDALNTIGCWL